MRKNSLHILRAHEISALLHDREIELIQIVRTAYETHASGASSLPHSTFLRFPNDAQNRIIALPAYLGGNFEVAGVKWIASFPANLDHGMERASAAIILNSIQTGRPEAMLEGSLISAKRTAASAALAAQHLHHHQPAVVGLIGCGTINFEIARFLLAVFPGIEAFIIFDTNIQQARGFETKCRSLRSDIAVHIAENIDVALGNTTLISFATTAIGPYVRDLAACARGSTILHISLRDLDPQVILVCDNVVDDIDHVCREKTSLHLAEQRVRHRDFIRCTIAEITSAAAPPRSTPEQIVVFSPFGLGVLDLAVSKFTLELARARDQGIVIDSFLPGF
jgi:N-[(2S)-2-amino-2-carboxyethyl]-L-glutamate dehydrogenase